MAARTQTTTDSSTRAQWMWLSNLDPWSKTEKPEWTPYSETNNRIIEKAYLNNQIHVKLERYSIDFKQNIQISNQDNTKRRPVKRIVYEKDDKHLQEQPNMPPPNTIKFTRPYRGDSVFIIETRNYLNLKPRQLPSQDETIVPMIVEKAASGIIEEGKSIGKWREAEELADLLQEKKNCGMKEIWKCCTYLYGLESFLYKKLNETMRLIGDVEHEQVWRSKVRTLGPFCLLLWDTPFNKEEQNEEEKVLYRGADLKDEDISVYQDLSQRSDEYRSFQCFSSCSRNRLIAEHFGNTLFIMDVKDAITVDVSLFSETDQDEEELIYPNACFTVQRVEFDKYKNKHIIYLKLKHHFSGDERFEGTSTNIEWINTEGNTDYQVSILQEFLKPYGTDPDFHRLIISARRNFIDKKLKKKSDIDEVGQLFDKAAKEKDPRQILRAYTAETDFYRLLNIHLAQTQLKKTGSVKVEVNQYCAWIAGIIAHHPLLDRFSFCGECYRGMSVDKKDLDGYTVGSRILTKSFLSSSHDQSVARSFATRSVPEGKISIVCIYIIRNPRTGLDLEEISMFPEEKEVLIMPYTAFKIMDVINLDQSDNGIRAEIKLKECEPC